MLPHFIHGNNARMLQRPGDLGFQEEARTTGLVIRVAFADLLQRFRAVVELWGRVGTARPHRVLVELNPLEGGAAEDHAAQAAVADR